MPKIVVVGRRIGEGFVELRDRATGEREDVGLTEIVGRLAG
jgi:prolyl-tRNA synthetase